MKLENDRHIVPELPKEKREKYVYFDEISEFFTNDFCILKGGFRLNGPVDCYKMSTLDYDKFINFLNSLALTLSVSQSLVMKSSVKLEIEKRTDLLLNFSIKFNDASLDTLNNFVDEVCFAISQTEKVITSFTPKISVRLVENEDLDGYIKKELKLKVLFHDLVLKD